MWLTLQDGADVLYRDVGNEFLNRRRAKSQKGEDRIWKFGSKFIYSFFFYLPKIPVTQIEFYDFAKLFKAQW